MEPSITSKKKEWTIDTHNMDKSQQYYTKWKKTDKSLHRTWFPWHKILERQVYSDRKQSSGGQKQFGGVTGYKGA